MRVVVIDLHLVHVLCDILNVQITGLSWQLVGHLLPSSETMNSVSIWRLRIWRVCWFYKVGITRFSLVRHDWWVWRWEGYRGCGFSRFVWQGMDVKFARSFDRNLLGTLDYWRNVSVSFAMNNTPGSRDIIKLVSVWYYYIEIMKRMTVASQIAAWRSRVKMWQDELSYEWPSKESEVETNWC